MLLLCTSKAFACGEFDIPVEVVINRDTDTHTERMVVAPLVYRNWNLGGATFWKGKSNLRVAMYRDEEEFPGKGAFFLYGDADFFEGTHMTLEYGPSKGGEYTLMCIHSEKVDWET